MPREDISTWYKKRYEADVLSGKIRDTNLNNARQLFQSLQATKDSWNQRSGKLNTKQLVRASVGDKYVFKQDKTKRVLKNTCVQILVDISGSMNGEKVIYAAHTSLQIIKLCDIFHLDSEVIGFTTSGAKLVHILYKVFGKRFKCPDYYLSRFWDSLEEGLCQNNDGDSIMFGRERLLKTGKNKRKIMFSSRF